MGNFVRPTLQAALSEVSAFRSLTFFAPQQVGHAIEYMQAPGGPLAPAVAAVVAAAGVQAAPAIPAGACWSGPGPAVLLHACIAALYRASSEPGFWLGAQ